MAEDSLFAAGTPDAQSIWLGRAIRASTQPITSTTKYVACLAQPAVSSFPSLMHASAPGPNTVESVAFG